MTLFTIICLLHIDKKLKKLLGIKSKILLLLPTFHKFFHQFNKYLNISFTKL